MSGGFKKSTEVLNDIPSQHRWPSNKSNIHFCMSQKPKSKTLKLSQKEEEQKDTNFDHGDGRNEREDHIQQRHGFKNSMPQGISFNSRYQSSSYGHYF